MLPLPRSAVPWPLPIDTSHPKRCLRARSSPCRWPWPIMLAGIIGSPREPRRASVLLVRRGPCLRGRVAGNWNLEVPPLEFGPRKWDPEVPPSNSAILESPEWCCSARFGDKELHQGLFIPVNPSILTDRSRTRAWAILALFSVYPFPVLTANDQHASQPTLEAVFRQWPSSAVHVEATYCVPIRPERTPVTPIFSASLGMTEIYADYEEHKARSQGLDLRPSKQFSAHP